MEKEKDQRIEKIKKEVGKLPFAVTLEKDFLGEKLVVYFYDDIADLFILKECLDENIVKKIKKFVKEIQEEYKKAE